jgi:plastocyanin
VLVRRRIIPIGIAAALTCVGISLIGTGVVLAQGSEVIVAGPSESFSQPSFNTDQGEIVQFRDDGGTHNVTARQAGPDGGPLFRSATISGGTTPVNGTHYLTTGDYQFFCSIHPTTMNGTLHVTGAGTPQPRPNLRLTLISRKLAKVVKTGKLRVGVNASVAAQGASIIAKLGKLTIASASGLSVIGGDQTQVLKLRKAGKAKLAKRTKATINLNGTIPFGPPGLATGKLK